MDSRTLYIRGFSYDGQGPDAYFYAGDSDRPSSEGFLIANEKGSTEILGESAKTNRTLRATTCLHVFTQPKIGQCLQIHLMTNGIDSNARPIVVNSFHSHIENNCHIDEEQRFVAITHQHSILKSCATAK